VSGPASGILLGEGSAPLATVHGPFRVHFFRSLRTRLPALLLARGDPGGPAPLLARVHSSCVTSETFGGCDCDCAGQLDAALARIARAGRGALFYLMQEGRGAGFLAKARDRMLVQASGHRLTTFEAYERMGLGRDSRRYDEVAAMCALLGIEAPLRLLSNNPDKVVALEREKVRVASVEPLQHEWSPFNLHYVAAKRRSGHALERPARAPAEAELPERVLEIEPRPLAAAPQLVHVASYLLPVRLERREPPLWLRLHAYLDRASGDERVAFSYGGRGRSDAPALVLRESLLERFPLADTDARASIGAMARWRRALGRFRLAGAGVPVYHPPPYPPPPPPPPPPHAAARALLAHHRAP
jgi:GTP cyclohydrolase II